jgi:ATP-dependent DNA helicase 2 subunit 2
VSGGCPGLQILNSHLMKVPFAEDMRYYTFAPLDKVVTMKGKVLTKHRNLPTAEMDEAMSDYVDSMNLMTIRHDEEGYTFLLNY